MLWTVTAFGFGGGSRTFLCGRVADLLVCPIACRFLEDSMSRETGRSALRLQRSFEFALFNPLGASGALREGLKTTSGGRLAGSAGV